MFKQATSIKDNLVVTVPRTNRRPENARGHLHLVPVAIVDM